jgi:hypothetical protein
VFVHIPKTGGTSITKALGHINTITVTHGAQDHRTIDKLRKAMSPDDFSAYFKFTFIRNTWSRVASWYKNVLQDPIHREKYGIEKECSFHEFLTVHGSIWGLQSQLYWIFDSSGESPLDFIGRFEQLPEHFGLVCDRIGAADLQLPHLVKAHDSSRYESLYDDTTRAIVAEAYAEEIELFGFQFLPSKSRRELTQPFVRRPI